MSKTTYRHYNLDASDRKTLLVKKFMGVDYIPSQLDVADFHATDLMNIIYKDGVNQKRAGVEQVSKIPSYKYHTFSNNDGYVEHINPTQINGLWQFVAEDGVNYVVAHIGYILFVITGLGKDYSFMDSKYIPVVKKTIVGANTYNVAQELLNEKSDAFVNDNRLYILGGNYLYYLRIINGNPSLYKVEDDSETYIPTTTIGIAYKEAITSNPTPLDDVNLMTEWRKNKLVSGIGFDKNVPRETVNYEYELDASIVCKNPNDLNDITIVVDSIVKGGE